MELDDLKIAWAELGQRTTTLEYLARRDYRARRIDTIRRPLRALGAGQALQSLIWIGVIAVVAPFWIEHRHVPHLLVAGLVLHLYGVATICASVVQLLVIGRTYYTAPIITFQRRVAELRRLRLMSTLLLGLPWWILWVPIILVGARWLTGVDLYARSPSWVHLSLAIGAAGMAATVWAANRLADRPIQSPVVRRMIDDLAGHSLRRVSRQLDEIDEFERE